MTMGKLFIYAVSAVCLSVASIGACPAESIKSRSRPGKILDQLNRKDA